ncbi:putative antirepressor, partial [Staphylococcus simiae CCM 7213 = CCUG 51256]
MNDLQTFNFEELPVRTLTVDEEPYFVGKDVAEVLGYSKARNAISKYVDSEDKKDAPIQGTPGGTQKMTIINESGLYSLIFSSKLESAKRFKRWVTSEVLPTLRKTGTYQVKPLTTSEQI